MNRPAVFSERRETCGRDLTGGHCDDWRAQVQRRLALLQYVLNDQGSVVDSSGNTIVDAGDTSGSGQTPAELTALGYTPDQIAYLAGSQTSLTAPPGSSPTVSAGTTAGSSGNSSWLSGLGSLFGTVSTTITNTTRALTNPNVNPATGLKYGINPATGLASAQTQVSVLWLVFLAVVAWFLFRK